MLLLLERGCSSIVFSCCCDGGFVNAERSPLCRNCCLLVGLDITCSKLSNASLSMSRPLLSPSLKISLALIRDKGGGILLLPTPLFLGDNDGDREEAAELEADAAEKPLTLTLTNAPPLIRSDADVDTTPFSSDFEPLRDDFFERVWGLFGTG